MKGVFYPKLALAGMVKNKRMTVPYLFTCIGMVMMEYIILFLKDSPIIAALRGAETVVSVLGFGSWVLAIFACIFLFYTQSFLLRRRKKEFGLYHILGMGKGKIGRILFWETLFTALISLGTGLLFGITFSKLAELGLVRVMHSETVFTLMISPWAVIMTCAIFGVIFALLFCNTLRQLRFASAVSLLQSESVGEKPPKGNLFLGALGILLLGAAYDLAVTIQDPVTALALFFLAVVMVILGTYLCMIAGSVLFCRLLQKKKSYYYTPNHFVSVSSMVYRMKRNGAGLASICILATMVLVTVSFTGSLYIGGEEVIRNRYPRDVNVQVVFFRAGEMTNETIGQMEDEILAAAQRCGATPQSALGTRYACTAGLLENGEVETDVRYADEAVPDYANLYEFYFIPLADYNARMRTNVELAEGEALLFVNGRDFSGETLSFRGGNTFRVHRQSGEFALSGDAAISVVSRMILIVPDLAQSVRGLEDLANFSGDSMVSSRWSFGFDTGLDRDGQRELFANEIRPLLERYSDDPAVAMINSQSRELQRESFYSLNGGLFYLGLLLSLVFLFAAVLMIYYKQISEGYEDQARFEIMQKVGMTGRAIRKSINSQLLTVFFLPLAFAALHLAFAFPILRKMLLLFGLDHVLLFAGTTVVCLALFGLIYTLVYRVTSNAYYHIVRATRERES